MTSVQVRLFLREALVQENDNVQQLVLRGDGSAMPAFGPPGAQPVPEGWIEGGRVAIPTLEHFTL